MIKIEDGAVIRFKMRGKHAEVSIAEPEYSLDEWDYIRTVAFARLRKGRPIPNELLDLVEHFEERTVVKPLFRKTADGTGITIGIKVPSKKTTKTKGESITEIVEMIAVGKRLLTDDQKKLTASEALAFFLIISLRELKYAEMMRQGAPVRTQQLVPRSVIAEVAADLLGSCELWNYSPGSHLNALIRELLNVDRDKHGAIRHVDERKRAVSLLRKTRRCPHANWQDD